MIQDLQLISRKCRRVGGSMREIKFRCWYDNQMHKVVDIDFLYKRINLFAADIINFNEGILMQYTRTKR